MKKITLVASLIFFSHVFSYPQGNQDAKTFMGINLGHTFAVAFVSNSIGDNVSYVPFHLIINHAFNEHFGISGLLLYRSEKDADYLASEMGFAVGPSYLSNSLNGFYIDCKFGIGLASGRDYYLNDYSRTDFVIQPDIGYYLNIGSKFTMIFGLGFQTLVLMNESPDRNNGFYSWDWNGLGRMSHYYLPVLNISLGIKL